MEILGAKNNEYNKYEKLVDLNRKLLSSDNVSTITQDLIEILNSILKSSDNEIITNKEVILSILILSENTEIKNIPIIKFLFRELKCRVIRIQALSGISNSEDSTSKCCTDENVPESAKGKAPTVCGTFENGRERFIPTNGEFNLPEPGKTGNLELRGVDYETNTWISRNVMIDSDGYFVREISYTHESDSSEDEIYSMAFMDRLNEAKKNNQKDSTDTIKEAEETCLTSGKSAADTGIKADPKSDPDVNKK